MAHGLRAHGVERGSVISCQLPNWNETILIFLAALRLGAVVNPIPPTYRANEMRFMLGLLESQVAVVPAAFRGFEPRRHARLAPAGAAAARATCSSPVARGPTGTVPLATLTDQAWEARAGRTGAAGHGRQRRARGGVHLGHHRRAQGRDAHARTPRSPPSIARSSGSSFSDRDVLLMASTLGHQTGYLYGYCLNLLLGATAVWMDVWNAEEAARLIEAEGVTFTMGATPFLRDLTYTAAPARPALAPRVHLGGRAHPAPAGAGRPGAPRLRHLRGLGDDRERSRHLQRTA